MMKPSKHTFIFLAALIGVLSFSPLLGLAQEKATQILAADFCNRFPEIEEKIITDVTQKEKTIINARTEGEALLKAKWAQEEVLRIEERQIQDEEYALLLSQAETAAVTETEKKAAIAYRTTIETAMTAFRKEVDEAILAYQTEMNTTMKKRAETVDTIVLSYKTGILSAINKTKAECVVNNTPLTARSNFKTELKRLEEKLKTDIKTTEKSETKIEELGNAKDASLTKAQDIFTGTVDAAGVKLTEAIASLTPVTEVTPSESQKILPKQ